MTYVKKILPWLSDFFQVALTLWLLAAFIEVVRPATFTGRLDLVAMLFILAILGLALAVTKSLNPALWLAVVDGVLVAMILWVIPAASGITKLAACATVLAVFIYLFTS